jgi:hypothetical protein
VVERAMQAARVSRRLARRARSPSIVRAPWRSSLSRSLQVQKIDSMRWRMVERWGPLSGSS